MIKFERPSTVENSRLMGKVKVRGGGPIESVFAQRDRIMGPLPTAAGDDGISWRILSTPPWTGEENMVYDGETLRAVGEGLAAPTLRFFRWSEPTVSFGRLQNENAIKAI